MTQRNLPLTEYIMRHDLQTQPADLYPTIMFDPKQVNDIAQSTPLASITLNTMLSKEDSLATDNLLYHPDYEPVIQEVMENSLSNSLMTKMLESSIIDYTDSTLYKFADTLFNHWIYLSTNGKYVAYTTFVDPVSNAELALSVLDTFIFAWYAYCGSIGINMLSEPIPPAFAQRVQRLVGSSPVSVNEIMTVVDPQRVDISVAHQALSMQPIIGQIVSTEAFYVLCQEIFAAEQMQRNLIAQQEDSIGRAMVENMVSRIYSDNICVLSPTGQTYASWFAERNIVTNKWSVENLNTIYANLLSFATGANLNPTSSLSALQTAMIGIMKQLSSYSVQYMANVNSTNLIQADTTAIRASNVVGAVGSLEYNGRLQIYPDNVTSAFSTKIYDDISVIRLDNNGTLDYTSTMDMEISIGIFYSKQGENIRQRVGISNLQPRYKNPLPTNTEGMVPVIGLETFLALSPDQRSQCRDVYSGNNTYAQPMTPYVDPGYVSPGYTDLE